MNKHIFFPAVTLVFLFNFVVTPLNAQFEPFIFSNAHYTHYVDHDTIWMAGVEGITKRQISTGTILERYDTYKSALTSFPYFSDICIDKMKRVWFCSESGLAVISNGKLTWNPYGPMLPELAGLGSIESSIATDSLGRIWLTGRESPYYFIYENGIWKRHWPSPLGTQRIKVSPVGKIYAIGYNGLSIHQDSSWFSIASGDLSDLVFDSDSSFYAVGDSIWHYENDIKPKVTMPHPGGRIEAVTLDKDRRLWIAGKFEGGVAWYDGGTWHSTHDSKNGAYTNLSIDHLGNIWATVHGIGTKYFNGQRWQWFWDGPLFVTNIAANDDGSLWIGFGGIIQRFYPNSRQIENHFIWEDSIRHRINYDLQAVAGNRFFSAVIAENSPSPSRLIWLDTAGQFQSVNMRSRASRGWPFWDFRQGMAVDKSDNVYSFFNDELSLYNPHTDFFQENILPDVPYLRSVKTDALDRVWVTDYKDLYMKKGSASSWKKYKDTHSAIDAAGPYCWVLLGPTIRRYDENGWESFDTPFTEDIRKDLVIIEATQDGQVWISPDRTSLYHFNGVKWAQYNMQDGSLPIPVHGMTADKDGTLWIWDSNTALARLKVDAGRVKGQLTAGLQCQNGVHDKIPPNIPVEVFNSERRLVALTDTSGNFSIAVPPGNYQVNTKPLRGLWQACSPVSIEVVANQEQTVSLPLQYQASSPYMRAEVGVQRLVRCREAIYQIEVCNHGNTTADSVSVTLALPPALTFLEANMPNRVLTDSTVSLSFGKIAVSDCLTALCTVKVGCDDVALGQTVCLKTHVFPDTLPSIGNSEWNKATLELRNECEPDSVVFVLKNTGKAKSAFVPWQVLKDTFLFKSGTLSLDVGEIRRFAFHRDTSIWQFSISQEPGHPYAPDPSLASTCQLLLSNGADDRDNKIESNTGNPFDRIECQVVVGSYDPNDKQAIPTGIGTAKSILPKQRLLQYTIRFQNTGTDTAFRVVVRDTLDPHLDWSSVVPGLSSHRYTMEKDSQHRILKFVFDPIHLPDSNVNEPASNGFLRFSVNINPKTPLKTQIRNRGAIYFDFNAPVLTNWVTHTIDTGFIKPYPHPIPIDEPVHIWCVPNPTFEDTWINIEPQIPSRTYILEIMDTNGKVQKTVAAGLSPYLLPCADFQAGLYFVRAISAGHTVGVAKLAIIRR